LQCGKRFTTYEIIEDVPIIVVKKDKSREVFDRNKILKGMLRACEKRHVTVADLEEKISEIEASLQSSVDREVTSARIGELIMEKLKEIDEVAYVRFASVYKEFDSAESFREELAKLNDVNK
jgi:transcriptional repressor NrdR